MYQKSVLFLCCIVIGNIDAQRLSISENGRFLMTEDRQPFFWMADTAWELFHRCNKEEAIQYLNKRAEQGFNVIQAVALAELDGIHTPNAYGEQALTHEDPTKPNEKYFKHIDDIINYADRLGMYIALLPTWGDKLFKHNWGVGPEIFNVKNAEAYGQWIGKRYRNYDNIIWIIGGDRNPRAGTKDVQVWNAMAEGIVKGAGGYEATLMSFHPQPKEMGGSSTWFHQEKWLDFNMHQTGHCADRATYNNITHDYHLSPIKPVLDGEPLYEDHPNCFNAKELGYSLPEDIRRIMYWNVFAGAFGQTYGCHNVWQMYTSGKDPINQPLRPWPKALNLPMANQVKHLKNLILSRPFFSRIPDQSLILNVQEENTNYVIATRDRQGSYAMIYFPTGANTMVDLSKLSGHTLHSWWFDPRTGHAFRGNTIHKSNKLNVKPPTSGQGQDWVWIVDDPSKKYSPPGKKE